MIDLHALAEISDPATLIDLRVEYRATASRATLFGRSSTAYEPGHIRDIIGPFAVVEWDDGQITWTHLADLEQVV